VNVGEQSRQCIECKDALDPTTPVRFLNCPACRERWMLSARTPRRRRFAPFSSHTFTPARDHVTRRFS